MNEDAEILGEKEFMLVKVKENLDCSLINGIDLRDLEKHAFSKLPNHEQFITGQILFKNADIGGKHTVKNQNAFL